MARNSMQRLGKRVNVRAKVGIYQSPQTVQGVSDSDDDEGPPVGMPAVESCAFPRRIVSKGCDFHTRKLSKGCAVPTREDLKKCDFPTRKVSKDFAFPARKVSKQLDRAETIPEESMSHNMFFYV